MSVLPNDRCSRRAHGVSGLFTGIAFPILSRNFVLD